MDISAQSILTVGGQSGPLQSIVAGLKPGDSLPGQVLARTPGGLALVALAGKQVHFPLPPNLSPGTLLTLTVQQVGDSLQFLIQAQNAAGSAARPAATPVSILPGGGVPALAPGGSGAPATSAGSAGTPSAAAQVAPRPLSAAPFSSSAPHLYPPLVNARTGLPVPAPQGATAGQTLTAEVLSTPTASTAIVSLGHQELPVSLPVPTTPGTTLPLVVQAGPDGLQLAHAPGTLAPAPFAPASPGAVLNQVGSMGQAAAAPQGLVASASAAPSVLSVTGAAAASGVPQAGTQTSPAPTGVPTASAANRPVAAPAATVVSAATPVVAQATLASLGNQNSMGALLSSVLRLGDRLKTLPEEVQRAAQRLSSAILPLDTETPSVPALRRAIARSGVFLESQLAAGADQGAVEADFKTLLITLRRALGDWLGADTKPAVLAGKPPPPPQHGVAPRAAIAAAPSAPLAEDASAEDIGKALLSQTDAALSRLRLHQIASLPDQPDTAPAARHDVHLEIPITIGQQPSVLGLVISRDAEGDTPDKKERNWRVQFAVSSSVIGEVGAEVGLLAGRTNVVLSAAQPQSAEALNDHLDELSGALEAVGLTPGILRVRRAASVPVPAAAPAASGRFLDRDT